jgi:cytochrome c
LTIGVIAASFGQSAPAVKGADRPALTKTNRFCLWPSPCDNEDQEERVNRAKIVLCSALALAASGGAASAAGDAAAGGATFRVCKTCHQIGEGAKNFVGPELNGVVGRKAGSAPGYNYSDANKNSGIVWDEATLTKYLRLPRDVVPGTKMAFPGMQRNEDVANVIAYLRQFGPDGKKM